jgi:hypothetical protein
MKFYVLGNTVYFLYNNIIFECLYTTVDFMATLALFLILQQVYFTIVTFTPVHRKNIKKLLNSKSNNLQII